MFFCFFVCFKVLLQPFNYDPNEKNKHKFMVQYMYLNDSEIHLGVNEILNMVIKILFLLMHKNAKKIRLCSILKIKFMKS